MESMDEYRSRPGDECVEPLFAGPAQTHLAEINLDQIRDLHYRPRLVTDWFLGEDRNAVLHQFRALHDLMAAEPAIELVPSHDPEVRARLVGAGVLKEGLAAP